MLRRAMMARPVPSTNTDNFDTDTLSLYTQYANAVGTWFIENGTLRALTGSHTILTRNGVSFQDGEASAIFTVANDVGLALRLQDNDNYYLAVICDNLAANSAARDQVFLYRKVSGAFTLLGSSAIPTFVRGTPTNLALAANGTALTIKVNGVTYVNATDSAIAAAGLCGPRNNGSVTISSFSWP